MCLVSYHRGLRHGPGVLTVAGLPAPASYSLTGEWRKGELNGRVTVAWGGGCQLQTTVIDGAMLAPAFATLKSGVVFLLHEGGWYTGATRMPVRCVRCNMLLKLVEGGWANSCAHGNGTLAFYDGSTYRYLIILLAPAPHCHASCAAASLPGVRPTATDSSGVLAPLRMMTKTAAATAGRRLRAVSSDTSSRVARTAWASGARPNFTHIRCGRVHSTCADTVQEREAVKGGEG